MLLINWHRSIVNIGASIHNIPSCILRLFNVYGPRQDGSSPYSGVISIFASKISNSETLTIYGTGEQTRDFIYVGDVAEYFYRGHKSADLEAQIFNICTGNSTSIETLSTVIADICKTEKKVIYEKAREGDILHSLGDNKRAISKFDYKPQIDIRSGLEKTIII